MGSCCSNNLVIVHRINVEAKNTEKQLAIMLQKEKEKKDLEEERQLEFDAENYLKLSFDDTLLAFGKYSKFNQISSKNGLFVDQQKLQNIILERNLSLFLQDHLYDFFIEVKTFYSEPFHCKTTDKKTFLTQDLARIIIRYVFELQDIQKCTMIQQGKLSTNRDLSIQTKEMLSAQFLACHSINLYTF